MRVGVFFELGPPSAGGGYQYQDDVFTAFVAAAPTSQHEFVVLCNVERATALAGRVPPNVTVRPFVVPRVSRRSLLEHVPLMRRCIPRREEVQPAPDGVDFMWFVGAPGRVVEVPYATVVWDLQHRRHPWFPEVSAQGQWDHRERLYQKVLRRAAYVVTGTEEGRREIERFYGVSPERIRVLPLATPRFALEGAKLDVDGRLAALGLRPGYLFYPAQFWAHKNHVNLLHALRLLHDEYCLPYELVLVGSDQGNETHVRKVAAELELDRHVRFLGFVPEEDLIALYRGADALAFVTFFGPDNLPPLEAFALGCPVIASEVPGAKEQLGTAALLVSPDSPRKIAEGIKRLRDDANLRESLREQGRHRAESWTGKEYVRGIFAIIDEFDAIRRCWA